MKIIYLVIIIFIFGSNAFAKQKYFGAPNKISDWTFSCSPDKGSIEDNYPSYVFKTSKNNKNVCKGGIYNQRAEILSKKALSLSTRAKYDFQTVFSFQDKSKSFYPEKFDIFQIHDGRNGCAPPLKVNIQSSGQLRLYADYKTGPGEQCQKDVIKSTGLGTTQIKRDGTEYKLNVLLNFDGKSGFDVDVYLDDKLEVSGKYSPPTGNKYVASKYFYFKHGVYSRNMFDYEMKSKISMKKVK